jgi:hypothetical protein
VLSFSQETWATNRAIGTVPNLPLILRRALAFLLLSSRYASCPPPAGTREWNSWGLPRHQRHSTSLLSISLRCPCYAVVYNTHSTRIHLQSAGYSLDHIALAPVAPAGGCCEKITTTGVPNDRDRDPIPACSACLWNWLISWPLTLRISL